jgi:hypothetical protein
MQTEGVGDGRGKLEVRILFDEVGIADRASLRAEGRLVGCALGDRLVGCKRGLHEAAATGEVIPPCEGARIKIEGR